MSNVSKYDGLTVLIRVASLLNDRKLVEQVKSMYSRNEQSFPRLCTQLSSITDDKLLVEAVHSYLEGTFPSENGT
jgi:hypothetical protein